VLRDGFRHVREGGSSKRTERLLDGNPSDADRLFAIGAPAHDSSQPGSLPMKLHVLDRLPPDGLGFCK